LRLILKYSNRRLYDTHQGRVITLLELSELVLAGCDIHVELKGTGEDISAVTMIHAILEYVRRNPDDEARAELAERVLLALRGSLEPSGDVTRDTTEVEKTGVGVI
jgi:hypothetical protein